MRICLFPLILSLLLVVYPAYTEENGANVLPSDLTAIGLQELMNLDLRVTTATRRRQKVSETASALYVITAEDIRRSGARHIAEALRLAPGVEVARINSNNWAVSIRGFNQRFAHQILVLVDGRSVFTPLFSGTFWETLSVNLQDVEQIEVIRGPGGSVWGANAVNGVINIVTWNSKETIGTRVESGGGSHERYFHNFRHGTEITDDTTLRVSHEVSLREHNELQDGSRADDDWGFVNGGFRLDSQLSDDESLTLLGDGYYQENDLPVSVPLRGPPFVDTETFSGGSYNSGANGSLRYKRMLPSGDDLELGLDYIFEKRAGDILPLTRHSARSELLYHLTFDAATTMTAGAGYSLDMDSTDGNFAEFLVPDSLTTHLYHGFAQVQRSFFDEQLKFLLGSKLEHNSYSGLEVMPTGRVVWTPSHALSVWAAYSRAASPPGRAFDDTRLPVQYLPASGMMPESLVVVEGSSDVESTLVDAYESGIRRQFSADVFADLSVFYNDFSSLLGLESDLPRFDSLSGFGDPLLLIPAKFGNSYKAYSYGSEASVEWGVNEALSLSAFYTFMHLTVQQGDNSLDSEQLLKQGNSPEHSFGFRARVNLNDAVEVDPNLRYVDGLPFGDISGYWELDLRVMWKIVDDITLSVVGRDLLHDSHRENLGTVFAPPQTRIERSVWGSLAVTF